MRTGDQMTSAKQIQAANRMDSAVQFSPLEHDSPSVFRDQFDRSPFLFRHLVAGQQMFSLGNLRTLATRMASAPGRVYYDTGTVRVHEKWGEIPVKCSLTRALDELPDGDVWIILKQANLDSEYSSVLNACIDELSERIGRDLNEQISSRILSIVISSPDRVTPYHMDGEYNFLLQCLGTKTMYVFDGRDRSIVTEPELERYWNSDRNAAEYKESAQSGALGVDLSPGLGVHVPLLFPHWVKNGPEVSVSVSINFQLPNERLANVYRTNYYLRKFGLRPKPPGHSRVLDGTKDGLFRAVNAVKRAGPSISRVKERVSRICLTASGA